MQVKIFTLSYCKIHKSKPVEELNIKGGMCIALSTMKPQIQTTIIHIKKKNWVKID